MDVPASSADFLSANCRPLWAYSYIVPTFAVPTFTVGYLKKTD
jgi:hypothetical protein